MTIVPFFIITVLSAFSAILTAISVRFNFHDKKAEIKSLIEKLHKIKTKLEYVISCNGDLAQAEADFNKVLADAGTYGITIEMMHAKYGLAAVAKAKGEKDEAIRLAQETREELSRLLKAHYLLDQVNDLLKELEAM